MAFQREEDRQAGDLTSCMVLKYLRRCIKTLLVASELRENGTKGSNNVRLFLSRLSASLHRLETRLPIVWGSPLRASPPERPCRLPFSGSKVRDPRKGLWLCCVRSLPDVGLIAGAKEAVT